MVTSTPLPSARSRPVDVALLILTISIAVPACSAEPKYLDLPASNVSPPDPGAGPHAAATCSSDGECDAQKPHCDLLRSVCVECLDSSACTKEAKVVCDPVALTCIECLSNLDCSADRPYCHTAAQQCVECLTRTDCADLARTCHPTTNRCVPLCASDATCTGPTPICSATLEICVECGSAADCTDAKKPLCSSQDGRCVACVSDAACKAGEVCDLGRGQCRPLP